MIRWYDGHCEVHPGHGKRCLSIPFKKDQLRDDNFAAYGPDLAMSLNNLSVDLADSGDRAGGLHAIQRAVEIREQLAQDNFAAYGENLCLSLCVLFFDFEQTLPTLERLWQAYQQIPSFTHGYFTEDGFEQEINQALQHNKRQPL